MYAISAPVKKLTRAAVNHAASGNGGRVGPGSSRFRVARSRTGLGLFALAPIPTGEFIIEYRGKRISCEQADRLRNKYLFRLNGQWVLDGSDRRNVARYINHACKPNAVARVVRGSIRIYARRNINPGDEITYHYGTEYFDSILSIRGCRCAACVIPATRNATQPGSNARMRVRGVAA